jgi:hypothetical protein
MKRVLSMILALAMLCAVFALTACGGTATPTTPGTNKPNFTGGGTDPVTSETELPAPGEITGEDPRPGFADVDFAGHTFTFASPLDNSDGWGDYEV